MKGSGPRSVHRTCVILLVALLVASCCAASAATGMQRPGSVQVSSPMWRRDWRDTTVRVLGVDRIRHQMLVGRTTAVTGKDADHELIALNTTSGRTRWSIPLGSLGATQAWVGRWRASVVMDDGSVWSIDPADGDELGNLRTSRFTAAQPEGFHDPVLGPVGEDEIFLVAAHTAAVVSTVTGAAGWSVRSPHGCTFLTGAAGPAVLMLARQCGRDVAIEARDLGDGRLLRRRPFERELSDDPFDVRIVAAGDVFGVRGDRQFVILTGAGRLVHRFVTAGGPLPDRISFDVHTLDDRTVVAVYARDVVSLVAARVDLPSGRVTASLRVRACCGAGVLYPGDDREPRSILLGDQVFLTMPVPGTIVDGLYRLDLGARRAGLDVLPDAAGSTRDLRADDGRVILHLASLSAASIVAYPTLDERSSFSEDDKRRGSWPAACDLMSAARMSAVTRARYRSRPLSRSGAAGTASGCVYVGAGGRGPVITLETVLRAPSSRTAAEVLAAVCDGCPAVPGFHGNAVRMNTGLEGEAVYVRQESTVVLVTVTRGRPLAAAVARVVRERLS